jgi:hypothetical protein
MKKARLFVLGMLVMALTFGIASGLFAQQGNYNFSGRGGALSQYRQPNGG